jgi:cbb3-type cytochrome oxidase subunit 1
MSLFYYFYAQIQAGYIFLMALSDNVLWCVYLWFYYAEMHWWLTASLPGWTNFDTTLSLIISLLLELAGI